ncbi:MAG: tyrosine-type recombinase/integrase [Bryobacteraceae bacterium]|jgi:integrase
METPTETRTYRPKGDGSLYQKADGRWYYSIMHKGKRRSKSLGTRDEEEATRNYQKVRNNLMGAIDRGEFEPTTKENVRLAEIVADYINELKTHRRKSASIAESVLLKALKAPEFKDRKVATLITADFKRYRDRLTKAGTSHATVNYHFTCIRAALNMETKQTPSRIGKVPFIPMGPAGKAREGFLEYNDHETLLGCLPRSLKALFVIALHSGCRLGELLAMRWQDVDWANRIVRLPDSKNGRKRNLPFWGGIEDHLKRQKAYRDEHHSECEHLFFWMDEDVRVGHGGARTQPGAHIREFRTSWTNAVKKAHGLSESIPAGLLFHDLRRSGIRVMVQEAGIPESQAMLISGHVTRSMLERYNIVSLKNVQDAGAKLDAWIKSKRQVAASPRPRTGSKSRHPTRTLATALATTQISPPFEVGLFALILLFCYGAERGT